MRSPTRLRPSRVLVLVGFLAAGRFLAGGGLTTPPSGTARRFGFDDLSAWKANPSDGVLLRLSEEQGRSGSALRMDFDFRGHAGWAAIRRQVDLAMPANFRFTLRLRGETPVNTLELKLIDPSGDNVWWTRRPAWEFPREWTEVVADRRRIEFAWGPSQTRALERVRAIEITVTAVAGGKGTVWLDELTFEELPPAGDTAGMPRLSASSSAPAQGPEQAMDGRRETAWRSAAAGRQSLTLDFGRRRELGGLVLDWAPDAQATAYSVATSNDGKDWKTQRVVHNGNGGRDYLVLRDAEGSFARLSLEAGAGPAYALREIEIEPPEFADSSVAVYRRMARDGRRGMYPRYLWDELAYWTAFGVDRDEGSKPLLSEDGMIETPAGFTLEPFLRINGRLLTWADARTSQSLEAGFLPLPSTTWTHAKGTLEIAPFASGGPESPILYARYRLRNPTDRAQRVRFFLAVRPLRISPPWHTLNLPEPTAPIRKLSWRDRELVVNDASRIVALSPPSAVAAASFDEGDAGELLDRASSNTAIEVEDAERHASAVLAWDLDVPPGGEREVAVATPLHSDGGARDAAARLASLRGGAAAHVERERQAAAAYWRRVTDRVAIDIPAARDLVDTVRASLAYILVARDGAAIRGGPRNYDRTWIRDGSLSSTAMLRFGLAEDVRAFIRWFAPFQFPDGKVPCCVDARGADPVPENDSHGELLYLVATYARLTGDWNLPAEVWSHVESAVAYVDRLREERRTEAYLAPDKLPFYGLLPESISHEGYSAKPMHSYWDDFWALRGLKDATWMAERLGKVTEAPRFAASRDELERDLHASIERAMALHHIDYIPGCAELGDFDPTSTTIAVEPGGEIGRLPRSALLATFERYWKESDERLLGRRPWTAYTPYEVRQVGTFVRLGWRDRAQELLAFLLDDRRPPGWKAWAEVVTRSYREPTYLGDLPHTWVASDFIRSFLDLLAYEREEDGALVLGAGIPEAWLERGVRVRQLRTFFGPLDFEVRREGSRVVARVGGPLRIPAGGVVLALPGTPASATVNGRPARVVDGRVTVREVPAEVVIRRRSESAALGRRGPTAPGPRRVPSRAPGASRPSEPRDMC